MFLYHDVSTAPLLDIRRRFKAVVDMLFAMIRGGVSLARSVELAVQWDGILRVGPIHPVTAEDFLLGRGGDLGQCCQVVQCLHRRLSDFIHGVVVHRRDETIRGWSGWLREDLLVHPYTWLRPELVPPAHFLQCDPALVPIRVRLMRNFEKLGIPIFVVLDKGRPTLRKSLMKLNADCLFFLRFLCRGLLVGSLLMLFIVKGLLLVAWTARVGVQGSPWFLV